ncbi:hypothetical protein CLW00_104266 [Mongoliibacter ruber]|uniref:Uncharacterized protein n=1 Tax=Mongoliibacter ruber TaxID=1750599 RepID=A0A2T0WPK4_9BACT|nr:hypothetical protein CLW00_104266 [Mongoliibacter ruber]
MNSFLQEILLLLLYTVLAVICLPLYLYLVWLVEDLTVFREVFILPNVIAGVLSLLLGFYFTRWVLSFLRSLKVNSKRP